MKFIRAGLSSMMMRNKSNSLALIQEHSGHLITFACFLSFFTSMRLTDTEFLSINLYVFRDSALLLLLNASFLMYFDTSSHVSDSFSSLVRATSSRCRKTFSGSVEHFGD